MGTKKQAPLSLPAPEELTRAIEDAGELNKIGYLIERTYDRAISLLKSALANPERLKKNSLQKAAKAAKIIIEIRNLLAKALEHREELLKDLSGTRWRNPPTPPSPPDSLTQPEDSPPSPSKP